MDDEPISGKSRRMHQVTVVPDVSRRSWSVTCPLLRTRRFVSDREWQTSGTCRESKLRKNDEKLLGEMFEDILKAVEPLLNIPERPSKLQSRASKVLRIPENQDGRLWVDKYAPTKFSQLLGDAGTNREALRWLRQWKNYSQEPQRYAMPDNPVLLLAGPPGVGKTSMATVLARQAGFRLVHVNASDERSAKSIKDRVKEAISNQAISFKSEPAPSSNCVILDEIDGACAGPEASNGILSLVGILQPKRAKDRQMGRAPVVAICNDVYAKVLRPLRRIGLVCTYDPPQQLDLKVRVREIAKKEGLSSEMDAVIDSVCESSSADVRCAVNTLQLLRNLKPKKASPSGGRTFHGSDILLDYPSLAVVGIKDSPSNAFDVWRMIFTQPKTSSRFGASATTSAAVPQKATRAALSDQLSLVDNRNIAEGCYENFLNVASARDRGMNVIVSGLEMHSSIDSLGVQQGADYNEVAIFSYHHQYAVLQNRRLKFSLPRQGTGSKVEEHRLRKELDIMRRNFREFLTFSNASASLRDIALMVGPFLVRCLFVTNKQQDAAGSKEAEVQALVDKTGRTLRLYGFTKGRGLSGPNQSTTAWRGLEPDIYSTVEFTATEDKRLRGLISENSFLSELEPLQPEVERSIIDRLDKQAITRRPMQETESPVSSRCTKATRSTTPQQLPDHIRSRIRTRYRFNEGHTLAVRRPIYLDNLL